MFVPIRLASHSPNAQSAVAEQGSAVAMVMDSSVTIYKKRKRTLEKLDLQGYSTLCPALFQPFPSLIFNPTAPSLHNQIPHRLGCYPLLFFPLVPLLFLQINFFLSTRIRINPLFSRPPQQSPASPQSVAVFQPQPNSVSGSSAPQQSLPQIQGL